MHQEVLTVYDHIKKNNRKTILLVFLFPLVFVFWVNLFPFLYFFFCLIFDGIYVSYPFKFFIFSSVLIFGIIFLWTLVAYRFGPKIVMSFAGTQQIDRKQAQYKNLYNIVENTSIMAGLPTPKLYLLDDDALNAFTVGTTLKNAIIVVSRGLVENLTTMELQGVIAHELAHIQSRDVRLNTLIVVGIGIFTLLGHLLIGFPLWFSSGSKDTSKSGAGIYVILLLIGFIFLGFGYLFAPLIQMAISRQREFAADALGAKILHNPKAIADALVKIKKNSFICLAEKQESIAFMCVASPEVISVLSEKTHPPIDERIRRLRSM